MLDVYLPVDTYIHVYKDVVLVNKVAEEYWGKKLGAVTACYLQKGQLKHMFGKHGSN